MDAGAGGVRIVSAMSARSVEDTKLGEAPPLSLFFSGRRPIDESCHVPLEKLE